MTLLPLPFVESDLANTCGAFFVGLILLLFRKTGIPLPVDPVVDPGIDALPFFCGTMACDVDPASGLLMATVFESEIPLDCFKPHELHKTCPETPFLQIGEYEILQDEHNGFTPKGIVLV